MMKRLYTLLLALLLVMAHSTAAVGTWKNHLAYHDITDVQQGGQMLYVLASTGLYTYNQSDKSIQTYDKTNGLSDCDIAFIRWNQTAKKLLIAYSDQNIDLLSASGDISNISDYYDKSMTGDKTIYSTYAYQQFVYLSTGFGIVKVDMNKEEISETYNLGFKVNYTWLEGGYIYASSQTSGTYRAATTVNLLDKSNWTRTGDYTDRSEGINADLLAIAKTLSPGGPKYNHFGYMTFKNNQLYTVVGGYSAIVDRSYQGAVQVLKDDEWSFFEEDDIAEKTGHLYNGTSAVDVSPIDATKTVVGARTGLYVFSGGQLESHYSCNNSLLYGAASSPDYTLMLGTTYDTSGNIWCFNSLAPSTTLMELKTDGTWVNHHNSQLLYNGIGLQRARDMKFDSRNLLWFVNNYHEQPALVCYQPSTEGVSVYNSFINQDGTTVATTYVRCVTEDLSGNMWIGTTAGPLVLEKSSIGQSADETTFTQPKVARNDGTNLADYLLAGLDITSIAIDGAGRKWFGTDGAGVYLISEDNQTQVKHFLSTNSPLLSNSVESIAINGETGEVFFGTDKGLCSYMSDATAGIDDMNSDNTYAYPNPVTPEYTGDITIKGLSYDSDIKIVTVNGTLVAKGRSNGGMFTWDGCDLSGNRVVSGIYIVLTATSDGSKGTACKIAVVR